MLIVKLLHVFLVIIWVGSLLVLSSLLSSRAREKPEVQRRLGIFLQRLYLCVDLPAMLSAIGLGIFSLVWRGIDWRAPWLHMKLTFVFLLVGCDFYIGWRIIRHRSLSMSGRGRRYRWFQGATVVCLAGILCAIYLVKNRN